MGESWAAAGSAGGTEWTGAGSFGPASGGASQLQSAKLAACPSGRTLQTICHLVFYSSVILSVSRWPRPASLTFLSCPTLAPRPAAHRASSCAAARAAREFTPLLLPRRAPLRVAMGRPANVSRSWRATAARRLRRRYAVAAHAACFYQRAAALRRSCGGAGLCGV